MTADTPDNPDHLAPDDSDEERVHRRARLLPEEATVGSDDPQHQAAAILTESDVRTADPEAAPDTFLEHRTSAEATDPAT